MGLDTILTSSLNDDTLSILQIVVYIDQAEDLIFLYSTSFEYQPKKERVYLNNLQYSCMDYGFFTLACIHIKLKWFNALNQIISSYIFVHK